MLNFARTVKPDFLRSLVQRPHCDPYAIEICRGFFSTLGGVRERITDIWSPQRVVSEALQRPTVFDLSECKTKPQDGRRTLWRSLDEGGAHI